MRPVPYRTLALLAAVLLAIIVPFCLFGARIDAWTGRLIEHAAAHPLFTGFALTLLLAVDIVLPVPSSLVSTACGMTLGFLGGACASFAGMCLSAAAGYLIGRNTAVAAERLLGREEVALLKRFQQRHGVWMLLALRPVPVLAEASILFSGLSHLPPRRVLGVTALGNAGVSLVYAAVGAWGRLADAFLPAFGLSLLLAGALLLNLRRKQAARRPPHPAR